MGDSELKIKLSTDWSFERFPVQHVSASFPLKMEHDVNYPRRLSHLEAFQAGWDAARTNPLRDEKRLWQDNEALRLERDQLRAEVERLNGDIRLVCELQDAAVRDFNEVKAAAENLAEALENIAAEHLSWDEITKLGIDTTDTEIARLALAEYREKVSKKE